MARPLTLMGLVMAAATAAGCSEGAEEIVAAAEPCEAVDFRNFSAWVTEMPAVGDEEALLIVQGSLEARSGGWSADLELLSDPDGQAIVLGVVMTAPPPDVMTTFALEWLPVRYEQAAPQDLQRVTVMCGETLIYDVAPPPTVY